MKKLLVLCLVLLLALAMVACGGGETPEPETPVETETPETPSVQIEEPEPVEEDNPLSTASKEEIQQAVIDALYAADHSTFINVGSTSCWSDYIAELLDIDSSIISPGWGSDNPRIISITLQRLDRHGNDIPRGNASEDTFSHWDFIYEFREERGDLRLFMRQHFDIEADMSGVTRENFDAIINGMSLDDVSALLGSEGTLGVTSGNHEVRTWSREFGGGTTVIISIYFIDDQVTSKAQVGW